MYGRMNRLWLKGVVMALGGLLAGCETVPPGAERGPHGTIAYDVLIEATEPGARIEINNESIANTPLHVKVYGDKDGTFHDFGSYFYVVRAWPLVTNQFVQTRFFATGRGFGPEDKIPQRIYFDMNHSAPVYGPFGVPPYGPPYPYYYGPYPYYYGPSYRFYYGPYCRPYHHW